MPHVSIRIHKNTRTNSIEASWSIYCSVHTTRVCMNEPKAGLPWMQDTLTGIKVGNGHLLEDGQKE